jgi:hypothetical protein
MLDGLKNILKIKYINFAFAPLFKSGFLLYFIIFN